MAGQLIGKGDGKWLLRVFIGSESVGGKRIRKYASKAFSGTTAQARAELRKMVVKADEEEYVPTTTKTVREFLEQWLEHGAAAKGKRRGISEHTKTFYRSKLRYAIEDLGHLRLDRLTDRGLQLWVDDLTEKRNLSPTTVHHAFGSLKRALRKAVSWKIISKNPCDGDVELPRRVSDERNVWDAGQVQRFLQETRDHKLHALWHLLLNSGMRPGEAFGLKWSDLSGDRVTIQRAVVELAPETVKRDDGREVKRLRYGIDVPKTDKSRRTIPLPPATIDALQRHRTRQVEEILATGQYYNRDGFMFATPTGNFLSIQPVSNRWETCVRKAKLPKMSLYGCRHTHATLLLTAGVPVKVVSERLGHASIILTLSTYQHVLPDMQEDAVNRLSALFKTELPQSV